MVTRRSTLSVLLMMLVAFSVGCLERELKPLNPCLVSGVVAEIAVQNVDKVDLLFVVDNSGSMAEEQELLRDQFPKLIQTLTSGMRADGSTFSPAKDLHLGVVSSDMGLAGVAGVMSCEKPAGDDGIMLNVPDASIQGCPASAFSERFLRYTMGGMTTPEQIGQDFGCIASLGTLGCGYEQQLEAGLKALWPQMDVDPATGMQWVDPATNMPSNRITFLSTTEAGRFGQGDRANAGFIRNTAAEGLSLIAVVVVTDEEDCSATKADHFVPGPSLPDGSPYAQQGQNLRCYYNGANLYGPERYVQGFQALRPGNENLVIFAAIAGVPRDLVTPERLEMYDFEIPEEREQLYTTILNDARMQEMKDPVTDATEDINDDNLVPSCDEEGLGRAYPPRRLVEVAKKFGANGIVQSICQENFEPAINAIIDIIAKQLGAVCLPRKLVRNASGTVGCNVVWELPLPDTAPVQTPIECGQAPAFLSQPGEGEASRTRDGRARCVVSQLAVGGAVEDRQTPSGSGWFYDDFSQDLKDECRGDNQQRIAFTDDANPPTGVTVQLECLSEVQTVAVDRTDVQPDETGEVPRIGTPCDDDETVCTLRLRGGGTDDAMFCHPELRTCVLGCTSEIDCPAAWVCDDEDFITFNSTSDPPAICVNPTCGGGDS